MQEEVIEGYRLSYNQKHLWLLQQADEGFTYRAHCAVRLEGILNVDEFKAALNNVVSRHEILRTSFQTLSGMTIPVQVIADINSVSVYEYDLSELSSDEQQRAVAELAEKATQLFYDLGEESPFKVSLVRLSPVEHVMLITLSSLYADSIGLRNLLREIAKSYEACSQAEELIDEPVRYVVASEWQNELLEAEDTEAGREYWRSKDISAINTMKLAAEGEAPVRGTFRRQYLARIVDPHTTRGLEELAGKLESTPSSFLLACWQVLMCRLTGQPDVIVGTAFDGRPDDELKEALGLFAKYLPIHSQLDEQSTFSEILKRVDESTQEVYEWLEFFTWEQVAGTVEQTAAESFFPICFEYEQQDSSYSAGGVRFSITEQQACTDRFRLKLRSVSQQDRLLIEFHYDSAIYSQESISRLAEQFYTLVSSALANPQAAVSDLEIVSQQQKRQLLERFNQTRQQYPSSLCVHELIERQAELTPDRVAVVCGAEELSYGGLEERANQLANYLTKQGVGLEDVVAICMDRSVDTLVALLAVLKAGGAYLPLDVDYPSQRQQYMLEDAGVKVLLKKGESAAGQEVEGLKRVDLVEHLEQIQQQSKQRVNSGVSSENLAYVIYTSGSTGSPKGVLIHHRSPINLLFGLNRVVYSDQAGSSLRASLNAPLSFDASMQQIILLANGFTLHIIPQSIRADGRSLVSYLESNRLDVFDCTPSQLSILLEAGLLNGINAAPRFVLVAGEAIDERMWRALAQANRTKFFNIYGPTESTVDATACSIQGTTDGPNIGKPLANYRTYILDTRQRPVPIGVSGELYIAGDGLARGYLNQPELTAVRFLPNPFSPMPGARMYRTGDLCRFREDSQIEFLARVDDQVKVRGYRIELGEIEAVLCQQEGIREAVAVVREDVKGDKRIVAYVVSEQGELLKAEEVRNEVKRRLPEWMAPSVVVGIERMPLTANGKVDRRALPAPEHATPEVGKALTVPRNPIQDMLVGIWGDILGLEQVGIHDNFFDVGGHSLLATRVISKIREVFQVELPMRRLFESPTIAGLAVAVETALKAGVRVEYIPIERISHDEEMPLSFAQQRLWFLDRLEPGTIAYNVPAAVHLKGKLDVDALEQSFNEVISRHEVLRTTFAEVDGNPVQRISPSLPLNIVRVDFSTLPDSRRTNELNRLADCEAQLSFDLSRGPLIRAKLVKLDEQQHVLLVSLHHIICDGWSIGILIKEMGALYEAYSRGEQSGLEELQIQYADYAAWQREWLEGEELEKQLSYWVEQLSGSTAVLDLSGGKVRPTVQTYGGGSETVVIDKRVTERLKAVSRRAGATLFMTLLAAFKALLYKYSGQEDILVGTPIAGRNRAEIEGLIGFFINTLVLRTDLSRDPSFSDLLGRVREVALGAYAHEDLPFEKLVEELQPVRDPSHTPFFQVMFVLQNAPVPVLELQGLSLNPWWGDSRKAKFDLTLNLTETPQGLVGSFEYNTDLFDRNMITRMVSHLQVLLQGVCANPHQRVSELPLLTEAEQVHLLFEGNDTKTDYPNNSTIQNLFEAQVKQVPDAVAVVFQNRELTYEELNRQANQLADHLRALGVRPEMPVGLCVERSLEMVVGLLGILKAGGTYVPLDLDYPTERLDFMLEDTGVAIVVTQQHLTVMLQHVETKLLCLDSDWDAISQKSPENVASATTADNLAYVMYTSGSTGRPKGIGIPHRAVARLVKNTNYASLGVKETILHLAPISFDASTFEIWGSLLNGGRLVVMAGRRPSLQQLGQALQRYDVTTLWLTAGLFNLMVDERLEDLRSVRQLLAGGETLSVAHVQRALEALPECKLINGYGPTETTTFACCYPVTDSSQIVGGVPIGRPIANTEVYVLDAQQRPVPIGVSGELYIAGDGLARGYLNQPELTAVRFLPNPFSPMPGARMYRTGDLCRFREDSQIEFLARVDDQVKVRGYRIELGEIEAMLCQQEGIREAVAVVREDVKGDKRIVAYVVSEQGELLKAEEVRNEVKRRLPEWMAPSVVVGIERMPLTANGKVDRRALPRPGGVEAEQYGGFVAPRTAIELQLIQLWEELLGIQPVGVTDDFFALGGHSLLAVKLIAKIKNRFGCELPLATLFQGATIEKLAAILRQQDKKVSWSPLVIIQRGGEKQPFFFVHPIGGGVMCYMDLARHMGKDQPFYGLQVPGVAAEEKLYSNIEEMASDYIEALHKVQERGPYLLGGWSFGGLVAFEMAHQLSRRGEEISRVILLDTYLPSSIENFADSDATLLIAVASDMASALGKALSLKTEQLSELAEHEQLTFVLKEIKKVNLLPEEIDVSQVRKYLQAYRSRFDGLKKYTPEVLDNRVTLFRASEQTNHSDDQSLPRRADVDSLGETLGWDKLSAYPVEVHFVPGDHKNMVRGPRAQTLAEHLKAYVLERESNIHKKYT